jgi:hypothetical protein
MAARLLFVFGLVGAAALTASDGSAQNASQVRSAHYVTTLTGGARYVAGTETPVTFNVTPVAPYTIDTTFQWQLVLHNPPGYKVAYAKNKYVASDAQLSAGSASFTVPALPTSAGPGQIDGRIHLRVCNGSSCDTQDVGVTLSIDIQPPSGEQPPPTPPK